MKQYFITTICDLYKDVNQSFLEKYLDLVLNYTTDEAYTERHHILPKSIFPQYKTDKWNIVKLSAKDHFYAHYYLYKAIPKCPKMTFALWGMCNQKSQCHADREYIDTLKDELAIIYEEARLAYANLISQKWKIGQYKNRKGVESPHYGKPRPTYVVDKMIKNHWSRWRKPWNHNKANKDAWILAPKTYNKWIELNKCGSVKLENECGLPNQYLKTIHQKFKEGWVPLQDKDFLEWLSLNT